MLEAMRVVSWFFVAALLTAGCAGNRIVVNGIEVYESYWNKALSSLEGRAAFEMQCPASSLQFLLLQRKGRYPSQIAVNGCGKRAMYVRSLLHGALTEWMLSSASWNEPSAPTPAPIPAPAPSPPPAPPSEPASSTGA